jgi:hypothetical protein
VGDLLGVEFPPPEPRDKWDGETEYVCVGGMLVDEGTIAGNVEVLRRFKHV